MPGKVTAFCHEGKWHDIEVETDGVNEQYNAVLRAFAGEILDGTPLIAGGEEGIHGLTLSNSMHLSSWLGAPVTRRKVVLAKGEWMYYTD